MVTPRRNPVLTGRRPALREEEAAGESSGEDEIAGATSWSIWRLENALLAAIAVLITSFAFSFFFFDIDLASLETGDLTGPAGVDRSRVRCRLRFVMRGAASHEQGDRKETHRQ